MKQRIIVIAIAGICFLTAIGIILYPIVSSYINEKYSSEIHTEYVQQIGLIDNTAKEQALKAAETYNQSIIPGAASGTAYTQEHLSGASKDYYEQLNLTESGIMGYVEIPHLNVRLPIYHGTGADSLERGVGHLLGSFLPVGGSSTHSILTGHSGMADKKLFTDLPQVVVGDVFYLNVLDRVFAYQVDQIHTVLPYDTTHLGITSGEDYCTLITCTPIGINTHRLLVRGRRIPYEAAIDVEETQKEPGKIQHQGTGSNWMDQYVLGLFLGTMGVSFMTLILCFWVLLKKRRKPKRRGKYVRT